MASHCFNDVVEDIPAPTDTSDQAKTKLKRRRVKREGPPQLQFLIATDPSQFRDEDAKRSVRSQAMIHWRHEEDRKKRHGIHKDKSVSTASVGNTDSGGPIETERTMPIPTRIRRTSSSATNYERQRDLFQTPDSSWLDVGTNSSQLVDGSSNWQLTATETASYFPQYQTRVQSNSDRPVTDYEESERHEERQLRTLVGGLARFYNIGGAQDPFDVLPQFQNPRLNALYLARTCMRAFASDLTMKKWLPLMLSHPHIILSSTNLASTWIDMHNNCSGDSTTTTMVKVETIGMINERLKNPALQMDDATLIVILHLFAGEMWVCNEGTLRSHKDGIAAFITQRGGLASFTYNKALAEVAVVCCQHCDIFCETEVFPGFRGWSHTSFVAIDSESAVPESPLFCPRQTYLTISKDKQCSQSTLELLSDMRDLTNIFLEHNTTWTTVQDVDAIDIARLFSPESDDHVRIESIRMRILSLPSAHTPGLLVTGDWVYEACRITALIYTTAIATGVPFSVAADSACVNLSGTSTPITGWDSSQRAHKIYPTEVLYETLRRTSTGNLWKDMSGVLYWVSAVGAAASRIPSAMDMALQGRLASKAYSVWVRRCLIMTATRTMIVLVFEHPTAIITAQQTLLKVQELLRPHVAQRPVV